MKHESWCRRGYYTTDGWTALAPGEDPPDGAVVWHSATCESPAENRAYAASFGGTAYANAVTDLLFARADRNERD